MVLVLPAVGAMVTAGQDAISQSYQEAVSDSWDPSIQSAISCCQCWNVSPVVVTVLLSDIQIVPDLGSGIFLLVFPKSNSLIQ